VAQLVADFLKTEYRPEAHIIGRGVLPCKGKLILAGSPKANKSFVAMNLMLDLVRGRSIFDAHYKRGIPVLPVAQPWRVTYLEMELGEQGLLERLRGKDDKPGLLTDVAPEGLQWFVQPRDTAMRLDTPEGRDFIEGIMKESRPDVLFIDPLAKFHLSNENDSQEMGAVLRVCDHLVEDYNCAVVLVHHIGKQDPDPEKQKRGGDRLRGSSAIFADVDTLVEVTRKSNEHHPEPVLELNMTLRRGEPIESLFVQRMRDGHIEWLGEGYSFGSLTPTTRPQKVFRRDL
jgi:RecA-family ATPase